MTAPQHPSTWPVVTTTREYLARDRVVERLWNKDHTLWKSDPTEITNRLGWLVVIDQMKARAADLHAFATTVKKAGTKDVVLLGMGGSSLGPEVLRASFGSTRGYPRLWVLDSTVPGWVRQVTKAIDPTATLFIVASKSGGTIEVMSLFNHFWELVHRTAGPRTGGRFIAITDPGTGLETLAAERQFWRIFSNPPDIGGRYSVLSYFGLVPAALVGIDVARLLERAGAMANACRLHPPLDENPGVELGATMGTLAKAGRDKVTLIASNQVKTFGLWAEQLLAESTGKAGTGLVPVADEPIATPTAYGQDRLFVYLRLKGDRNGTLDRQVAALAQNGHPVVIVQLKDRYDLGAEFFRWEFATSVASHVLGIHPFDQPNVQESKDNTTRVLGEVQMTGHLPNLVSLSPSQAAKQLMSDLRPGAYVGILAYTTPSSKVESAIRAVRKALVARGVTTTAGYGPRYLHSTGQLHKGGPKTGLFLELIDNMTPDLSIPGKPFTFGTLAKAQATGDLQSLQAHDRQVVMVRLGKNQAAVIQAIAASLAPAAKPRKPASTFRRRIARRHR